MRKYFLTFVALASIIGFALLSFWTLQQLSRAAPKKANITIDATKITGFIPNNWKALAQGGEEKGVRMLENVIGPTSELFPDYVRLDHIYDFYDVVSRDTSGNLTFNWEKLDATICDIYRTGAKPFLSLGYMPPAISSDGSLISQPSNWEEWALVVQKTIERYSGRDTVLCGGITGNHMTNIYYEVWNEPDLETFGKWHYSGSKSYNTLYYYSALGAARAQNVHYFLLGGPATTALYRNWIISFLDSVDRNKLKMDFISWHHYSARPDDYIQDIRNLDSWLSAPRFEKFRSRQRVISEWGYDSNPNPISETSLGAAHTIASIRNLIDNKVDLAFAFEIKDGPNPSWGMLSYQGEKKPRYHALKLLRVLDRYRLEVNGEGTFVKAISSIKGNEISVVLVNYDPNSQNTENVPINFINLSPGNYTLGKIDFEGNESSMNITVSGSNITQTVIMPPNYIIALTLKKQ